MKSKSSSKINYRKWFDEWGLAARGIMMATRERRFWAGFVIAFVAFGTLVNMLSGGLSKFELMGAVGFPQNLKIMADALLGVFGYRMAVVDWLAVFPVVLMQGILVGLIVLMWGKRQGKNQANVERAGIVTGLIALGAGCPTCGTTLLAPLLGALFSTGSLAFAGVISGVVTGLAILVAILALKRLGLETYVIIVNEKYLAKKRGESGNGDRKKDD